MNILSQWIRSYVPGLTATDRELAEALTLRGIAVEGIYDLGGDVAEWVSDAFAEKADGGAAPPAALAACDEQDQGRDRAEGR